MQALRRLGADVRVLAFEREGQLGALEEEMTSLGTIENEEFRGRAVTYLRSLRTIRAAAASSDAIYTFGVDLLALVRAALTGVRRKPVLATEVGDITAILVEKGRVGRVARRLERFVLADDALLVATSPAFIDEFYRGIQGLDISTLVIENKVDPEVTPGPLAAGDGGRPLRIGWFGMLRCEYSWVCLKRVAEEMGQDVEIVLRGVPYAKLSGLAEEAAGLADVRYEGRYRVPEDLPGMYGEVDLCWMVHHDPDRPLQNWSWARSNRLYQAGWFGTPIVGQRGKDDARLVEEEDLGIVVDVVDVEGTLERLKAVTSSDLGRWRANLRAMPRSAFALTDEHEELLRRLAG
jgi:succinoglycan biosynthesis protein ExoL